MVCGNLDISIRERQSFIPWGCWRTVWQGDSFNVSGAVPDSQLKATRATSIDVFLDYELGEVSFYGMPEKCHLYTFGDTFTGPVSPYFFEGPPSEPLRLSLPQVLNTNPHGGLNFNKFVSYSALPFPQPRLAPSLLYS